MLKSIHLAAQLFALGAALSLASGAFAQAPELVFGVNEGVTYRITPQETRDKYKPLADLLSATLKRPVRIEPIDEYPKLRAGLDAQKYDIAYVHPAHHAMMSVRDARYSVAAVTKGYTDYKAQFLLPKDSPLKQPADLKGRKIGMPDPDSITAVLTRATLRDLGADPARQPMQTTRYQEAVLFFLENGFAEAGTTGSAAVARDWQQKGGRVLFESRSVPVKQVIVSNKLTRPEYTAIRDLFLNLENTEPGRKALERIGFKGYQAWSDNDALALVKWLGV